MNRVAVLSLACLLGASRAHAQQAEPEKGSAKALMQSGLKLFSDKDYLGALAVFTEAFDRFPTPNILLNIGTTLLKLERKAEAANAYQRYLDLAGANADKRDEVTKVLAELDQNLGILEITVSPDDAEVNVGDGVWRKAALVAHTRVPTGRLAVQARRDGYRPAVKAIEVGANESRDVSIELVAFSGTTGDDALLAGDIGGKSAPPARARFGAFALGHVDALHLDGGAALVGASVDFIERAQAQLAALIGPSPGAYIGGTFAILTGRVRPFVGAGMPMFVSDGLRFGIRGAVGVELALTRHIGVIGELGVEHLLNPEMTIANPTQFVPAIGAIARL